jgi:hypothetical protein
MQFLLSKHYTHTHYLIMDVVQILGVWCTHYQYLKEKHKISHPLLETSLSFYILCSKLMQIDCLRPDVIMTIDSMFDTLNQWIETQTSINYWICAKCEKCKVSMHPFMPEYAHVVPTRHELKHAIMRMLKTAALCDVINDLQMISVCEQLQETEVPIADSLYIRMIKKLYIKNSASGCGSIYCTLPPAPRLARQFNISEITYFELSPIAQFKFEGLLLPDDIESMKLGWMNRIPLYFRFSKSDRVLFCQKNKDDIILCVSASVKFEKIVEIHFHGASYEFHPKVFSPA